MNKGRENKPHIGIFGRRNMGKSSLINALAGQDIAIVSDVPGTTTDPVRKSIEIHGLGAVVLIDTAGIDDTGELGSRRVSRSRRVLQSIDLAILVISHSRLDPEDLLLMKDFLKEDIPFFLVNNKSDIEPLNVGKLRAGFVGDFPDIVSCSSTDGSGVENVIAAIARHMPSAALQRRSLLGDLISYGDVVLLVTPIDAEAPEGRLILPQVQVIRDVLDNDGVAIVLKERELDTYIARMQPKPSLVVTDSQVFLKVDGSVPADIPMTSFSIVLARQKGAFESYIEGTRHISRLKDGDKVLLLESCTHHVSCDDIGRTKIPRWITNFTGKKLHFETVAGLDEIPGGVEQYALVIQCGGCVITHRQLYNRIRPAIKAGVPVTNYGMAIAYVHGIFERAVRPFITLNSNGNEYL